MEVTKPSKSKNLLPTEFTWDATNTNIVLEEDTDEKNIQQIEFFFASLGVEGIRYPSYEKIYNAGYTHIDDIAGLPEVYPGTLVEILGKSKGTLLENQITTLMYDNVPPLVDIIVGSALLGQGFGYRKVRSLLSVIPDILTKDDITEYEVPLISKHTMGVINSKLDDIRSFIEALAYDITDFDVDEPIAVSDKLKGVHVVFTGVRAKDLEATIIDNGGTVGNFTKATTAVIAKDPNSGSSKLKAARDKDISIYSVEQFINFMETHYGIE